jgi:hypothetical protein
MRLETGRGLGGLDSERLDERAAALQVLAQGMPGAAGPRIGGDQRAVGPSLRGSSWTSSRAVPAADGLGILQRGHVARAR